RNSYHWHSVPFSCKAMCRGAHVPEHGFARQRYFFHKGEKPMPNDHEFVEKFWKSIRSDMTAMLGTSSYPVRPMTAQFDGDRKTIYFFTTTETDLGKLGSQPTDASLIYAAKGHGLFANV